MTRKANPLPLPAKCKPGNPFSFPASASSLISISNSNQNTEAVIPLKAMSVPPSISVAWAWVLEALSQVKEAYISARVLLLLVVILLIMIMITIIFLFTAALLKAVPDLEETLKIWKSAEERLALRFLEDGIAADPTSDGGEPVEIDLPLDSVSGINAIEVLEKVETSGSLVKCGSELKEAISQFILKKKATLPKCAIQKLQDYVTKAPSRKGKFIGDSSCNINTAQELEGNGEDGEIQPLQQNSASFICKIGNEALQKHLHEFPTGGAAETSYVVQPLHNSIDKANDGAAEATHEVHHQDISAGDAQDGAVEINICVDESPLAQNLDDVVGGAEHVLVPETSSSSDGEHQTISDEERLGKGMFLRSLNVLNNDSLAIDWTAGDDYCINCEEGGQLLSCSNSSCLFAVHESCLGSPIIFEGDGSYYCPFCSYTRAYAAYRKAKKKLSMSWRAMTAFSAKYPLHQEKCKKPTAEFPSKPVEARNKRNSSPSKVAENSPISKKHSCGIGKDAKGLEVSDTPGPSMQRVDEETTGNQKTGLKLSSERAIKRQRPVKR
ncbi:hypothetical protein ACLOJK_016077 [Asimina triloba]